MNQHVTHNVHIECSNNKWVLLLKILQNIQQAFFLTYSRQPARAGILPACPGSVWIPEAKAKHHVWERGQRQALTIFEWEVPFEGSHQRVIIHPWEQILLGTNLPRSTADCNRAQQWCEEQVPTGAQLTTAAVRTTPCTNSLPVIGGYSYQ